MLRAALLGITNFTCLLPCIDKMENILSGWKESSLSGHRLILINVVHTAMPSNILSFHFSQMLPLGSLKETVLQGSPQKMSCVPLLILIFVNWSDACVD